MTTEQEAWQPATADDLKVGDHIRIDHRWFDHPFERRMFRIGSDREIAIIREKELTRVHVDRSQSVEDQAASTPTAARDGAATADDAAPGASATAVESQPPGAPVAADAAQPPVVSPADPQEPDPRAAAAHAAAIRAEQRAALEAAKARDRHTREQAQITLSMLGAGHTESAATVAAFVDYLVAILNNSTSPIAPMSPAAPRNSTVRLALLGSDAVWIAGLIGKRMGLARAELRALTHAAAVHAAGLTRLPPPQAEEEPGTNPRGTLLGNYPAYSAMILEQCGGFDADVMRIVREHRERPDGSGFPRGLKGEQIHPHALIIGAVRELQIRCAGSAVSPAVALASIYKTLRGTYGATIANHLAAAVLLIPVGTYVQLSDGSVARVSHINEASRLLPVVECFGPNAELRAPEIIDLSQRTDLFIVRALDTSRLPPRMFKPVRNTGADTHPPVQVEQPAAEAAAPAADQTPAAQASGA